MSGSYLQPPLSPQAFPRQYSAKCWSSLGPWCRREAGRSLGCKEGGFPGVPSSRGGTDSDRGQPCVLRASVLPNTAPCFPGHQDRGTDLAGTPALSAVSTCPSAVGHTSWSRGPCLLPREQVHDRRGPRPGPALLTWVKKDVSCPPASDGPAGGTALRKPCGQPQRWLSFFFF